MPLTLLILWAYKLLLLRKAFHNRLNNCVDPLVFKPLEAAVLAFLLPCGFTDVFDFYIFDQLHCALSIFLNREATNIEMKTTHNEFYPGLYNSSG